MVDEGSSSGVEAVHALRNAEKSFTKLGCEADEVSREVVCAVRVGAPMGEARRRRYASTIDADHSRRCCGPLRMHYRGSLLMRYQGLLWTHEGR